MSIKKKSEKSQGFFFFVFCFFSHYIILEMLITLSFFFQCPHDFMCPKFLEDSGSSCRFHVYYNPQFPRHVRKIFCNSFSWWICLIILCFCLTVPSYMPHSITQNLLVCQTNWYFIKLIVLNVQFGSLYINILTLFIKATVKLSKISIWNWGK